MKLFKRIVFVSVSAMLAIGLGTGLSLNYANQSVKEASATTTAGTYTYDFVTNFSTYASSWTTAYTSHTIASTDLGTGLPSASLAFTAANKQGTTITTMPVTKVGNLVFTLNETGFAITGVSATFSQWTTKVPTIVVCEGSTSGGTQLYTGNVGLTSSPGSGTGTTGDLTVSGSGINSIYFGNTASVQVGWASISITIAEFSSTIPVSSVTINPSSVYLSVGSTKVVSATVLPSNATDGSLTWVLSSVSPSGSVTWDLASLTLTGVSVGTATLTATANDGSGVYSSISISVVEAYSIKFSVSDDNYTALTTDTIGTYLTGDGSSMTYTALTSVYANATDVLKIGASSTAGSMSFTLPTGYGVTQVVLLSMAWTGDVTSVAVNGGTAQTISDAQLSYYSYDVNLASSVTIASTVASHSRFYLSEIILVKQAASNADVVAAFVSGYMHPEIAYNIADSDTGACSGTTGYYALAKDQFNNVLTTDQKTLFVTDATYSNPYARLLAWATANGEVMLDGNVLGASSSNNFSVFNNTNYSMAIIVIMSMASLVALGAFFFVRKKKEVK